MQAAIESQEEQVDVEAADARLFSGMARAVIVDEYNYELPEPDDSVAEGDHVLNQGLYRCSVVDLGQIATPTTVLAAVGTNSKYVDYDYEFNESSGSSDSFTVGLGFSLSGTEGTFETMGTTVLTSSTKLSWRQMSIDDGTFQYFDTRPVYHKYRGYCTACYGLRCVTRSSYEVRPAGITGDATSRRASYPGPLNYCAKIGPGNEILRSDGSHVSFRNGVDISSGIGIDLSSSNQLSGGSSHRVGNKRLGWLATAVFLELNGASVAAAPNEEVYNLVMSVAATDVSVDEVAAELCRLPGGSGPKGYISDCY